MSQKLMQSQKGSMNTFEAKFWKDVTVLDVCHPELLLQPHANKVTLLWVLRAGRHTKDDAYQFVGHPKVFQHMLWVKVTDVTSSDLEPN